MLRACVSRAEWIASRQWVIYPSHLRLRREQCSPREDQFLAAYAVLPTSSPGRTTRRRGRKRGSARDAALNNRHEARGKTAKYVDRPATKGCRWSPASRGGKAVWSHHVEKLGVRYVLPSSWKCAKGGEVEAAFLLRVPRRSQQRGAGNKHMRFTPCVHAPRVRPRPSFHPH